MATSRKKPTHVRKNPDAANPKARWVCDLCPEWFYNKAEALEHEQKKHGVG